ncbi:hypothetical protein SHKM778_75550 [Streptomyces sp. KM77-8]|uniref:Uncharacterized protein n=1 Tax=Streptomyces haneummycinicus TaxID=3074435 RepID=A0AAT9HV69_9ACTN
MTDNIFPTSYYSGSCRDDPDGGDGYVTCLTDNSTLTYYMDSGGTYELEAVDKSNVRATMNNDYEPTDLSVSYDSSPPSPAARRPTSSTRKDRPTFLPARTVSPGATTLWTATVSDATSSTSASVATAPTRVACPAMRPDTRSVFFTAATPPRG